MIWHRQPDSERRALSPEMELLLYCARPRLDSPRTPQISSLAARPLDWDRILTAATSHGLAPLLFRHLADAPAGSIPPFVLDRLRASFERTTRQNLSLIRELFSLLDLFHASQIPVVSYKGPVLATLLYGHPGLRPCRDLDLLVQPRDVARAVELLGGRGYQVREPAADDNEDTLEHECAREMIRDDGRIVEVHWGIVSRYLSVPFECEDIWRRVTTVPVYGRSLAALPAEVLLPILCVHGMKHQWERLEWLCDVSLLTGRVGDWETIWELTRRTGTRRTVLLGLELARDLLDTPLPPEVRQAVRADAAVAGLVRTVRAGLDRPNGRRPGFLETHRFRFTVRERMRDRVKYAARPSPKDREFLRLPDSLDLLYLAVKPVRIAWHRLIGANP